MGFTELDQVKFKRKTCVYPILFRSPPHKLWLLSATTLAHAAETTAAHRPASQLVAVSKVKFFLEDAGITLLMIPSETQNSISVSSELLRFTWGVLEEVRMPSISRRRFHTFYMHLKLTCLMANISGVKNPSPQKSTHFCKIKNITLFLVIKVPSFWRHNNVLQV